MVSKHFRAGRREASRSDKQVIHRFLTETETLSLSLSLVASASLDPWLPELLGQWQKAEQPPSPQEPPHPCTAAERWGPGTCESLRPHLAPFSLHLFFAPAGTGVAAVPQGAELFVASRSSHLPFSCLHVLTSTPFPWV